MPMAMGGTSRGMRILSFSFLGSSDMSKKDKRGRERYGLKLPVRVTWEDASGIEHGETTATQDISLSGCHIVCGALIEKGSKIDVEMDLSIAEAGITRKRVIAQGRVVRNGRTTDTDKGGFGHGVKFDKFRFPKR
jgi:hypothetical protein